VRRRKVRGHWKVGGKEIVVRDIKSLELKMKVINNENN